MTPATRFAYERLWKLNDHADLHAYGPDLLISDVKTVVAELARTNADLAGCRDALTQAQHATEAERAARSRYDSIVHCARLLLSGPDAAGYTRLAAAIDACEKLGVLEQPQGSRASWLAYANATCARCGSPLDNVSPGFSIVTGVATVCAQCLVPGEEIARARSISKE